MTNSPTPPINPFADPDAVETETDTPVQEVDGEEVLDPDADPDQVDSAEADRLATGADRTDEPAITSTDE